MRWQPKVRRYTDNYKSSRQARPVDSISYRLKAARDMGFIEDDEIYSDREREELRQEKEGERAARRFR